LADGLSKHGLEVEPECLIEEGQRRGVRIRVKPTGTGPATKLEFAPSDLVNFVTVNEARDSQGLRGISGGDITVAAQLAANENANAAAKVPGVDVSALGASKKLRLIAKARGWRAKRAA
jgi:hypothetical protein